ncbi:MAG: VOC family protein, partial [Pseudomonadota bacterium]
TFHAVDHVVVNTSDGDKAISVFGDKMGIRLALDRDAKQWGARMMFFRLGGITLEVIQRYGDEKTPAMPLDAPSVYWGMAFRAHDVAAAQARLASNGVNVSEVRKGRKPGTLVATVRDKSGGVPVLIVGPDPDAAPDADKTA